MIDQATDVTGCGTVDAASTQPVPPAARNRCPSSTVVDGFIAQGPFVAVRAALRLDAARAASAVPAASGLLS